MATVHDNILHESALLNIGTFDCPVSAPDFTNTGAIEAYILVFPRTAVKIRHENMKEAFIADPNTITVYNKGQQYERYPISDYGDRCDWIALDPTIICEILADLGVNLKEEPEQIFQLSHSIISAKIYSEFCIFINKLQASSDEDILLSEEWALNFSRRTLAEIYGRHSKATSAGKIRTGNKHRRLASNCLEILNSHYTENLSLNALAKELNTSPYHLSRVFSSIIGLTIHQYLCQLRLRSSLYRVAETKEDLSTLGLNLGFCDHSHFSHYFKKHFGQTPSAYRRSSAFCKMP
ncbi:helix-turn-helix domain-containing protein [Agarilytica rhodophyticola]|uniref:helix-turn-helix domain-containing protein n=1 Tax=Agarilytica rhodophyticola TaxID=1737490 RepID=UPI000B34920E|nr:AraC family transcriptional regulator [Agarilytica rhodophyticola]